MSYAARSSLRSLRYASQKLCVSDDVIRKIVTSARKKICKMVAVMEVSTYAKFHCNSTFVSKVI